MTTVERFVDVVRSFVGTPYGHIGTLPGIALSCIGVPWCALREIGVPVRPLPSFGQNADGLLEELSFYAAAVDCPDVGDLLTVVWKGEARHCMVISGKRGDELIVTHASAEHRKVVEHALTKRYRIHSAWRLKAFI